MPGRNLLSVFIKVLTQKQNTGQTSTAEHLAALGTQCLTLPEGRGLLGACRPRHSPGPGARQTSWVRFFSLCFRINRGLPRTYKATFSSVPIRPGWASRVHGSGPLGRCLWSPSLSTQQRGIQSQFVRTRLDSISHQKLGLCHIIRTCEGFGGGSQPSSLLPPAKPVPVISC